MDLAPAPPVALAPALPRERAVAPLLAALAGGLVLALVANLLTGAVPISPGQAVAILADRIGLSTPWSFEPHQAEVLLTLRLPRALMAAIVGAGLAVCGAAMQGLFRNPLADPALIGVSSGAALGAAGAILAAPLLAAHVATWSPTAALPIAAFAGGLAASLLVYRLSSHHGRTIVATLLLAGIAVNALAGAALGLMIYLADDAQLRTITFWTMGSLGAVTWPAVLVAGLSTLVAGGLVAREHRGLNALLLGEAEAGHLGVDVQALKRRLVVWTSLAVATCVCTVGIIAFVGLVTPHLLRLRIGPDHRVLLPASALLGAGLLAAADLGARTLAAPSELPIGVLTALVGGPFFLWLLVRDKAGGEHA